MSTSVTPEDWPRLRVVQVFVYSAPVCDTPEHTDKASALFSTPDGRGFAACVRCVRAVEASKRLALGLVKR